MIDDGDPFADFGPTIWATTPGDDPFTDLAPAPRRPPEAEPPAAGPAAELDDDPPATVARPVDDGLADPAPPEAQPAEDGDPDNVIITVVAGLDGGPAPVELAEELDEVGGTVADVPPELLWLVGEIATTRKAAVGHGQQLAAIDDRLAPLEGVAGSVDALGRATRQELERCAGVLFAHDRALHDTRDQVASVAARLAALETGPAPAGGAAVSGEALVEVLSRLDDINQRLGAMEARVEPLEPVPTIVQALRRAVRASDELLAGEASARERGVSALADEVAAQAQARDDAIRRLVAQDLDRVAAMVTALGQAVEVMAGRLAAAEARLVPLDSVPADIEALSRILRRELDAVTADNQARDQMLRRALQNEIDNLRSAADARDQAGAEVAGRLEAVERSLGEAAAAHVEATGSSGTRLDALEGRMVAADDVVAQVEALREVVRTELDQVRADARAHDQVMGEITRAFSALDARLARVDPVPSDLLSLRTALRQESERNVSQLRGLEERLGQLAWVPGEFQEARKRILSLTSGLQQGQDAMRAVEAALASTDERVKALGARVAAPAPPEPPE